MKNSSGVKIILQYKKTYQYWERIEYVFISDRLTFENNIFKLSKVSMVLKKSSMKYNSFIISLFILLNFLFSGCSKSDNIGSINISNLESVLGAAESEVPFEGDYLFLKMLAMELKKEINLIFCFQKTIKS